MMVSTIVGFPVYSPIQSTRGRTIVLPRGTLCIDKTEFVCADKLGTPGCVSEWCCSTVSAASRLELQT